MADTNSIMKVNVFIPCCMDMFNSGCANNVFVLLKNLGVQANYIDSQTCCGRRFYMEGDIQSAYQLGHKVWEELQERKVPTAEPQMTDLPLVVPSSACAGYMKSVYPSLFGYATLPLEMKKFTANVYELCDFIVNVLNRRTVNNTFNHRVFYFKSCAARNVYPDNDAAEVLLKNTAGLDLLTNDSLRGCCGANGAFAVENPEVSDKMVQNIVDKIYAMGAEYVTSTDLHCLQQLDAFIQAKGIGLEVMHITDILVAQ